MNLQPQVTRSGFVVQPGGQSLHDIQKSNTLVFELHNSYVIRVHEE